MNPYRIKISSTSTDVQSMAHLDRSTWSWVRAYDYFCLIARELGATDIPAKPEQPVNLQIEARGYLIQLTV